jgi:hypothetical protein
MSSRAIDPNISFTASASAMSHGTKLASGGNGSVGGARPQTITSAPCAQNRSTIARPMPRVPPVTSTVRSLTAGRLPVCRAVY